MHDHIRYGQVFAGCGQVKIVYRGIRKPSFGNIHPRPIYEFFADINAVDMVWLCAKFGHQTEAYPTDAAAQIQNPRIRPVEVHVAKGHVECRPLDVLPAIGGIFEKRSIVANVLVVEFADLLMGVAQNTYLCC
jgi:hypothetical protein